MSGANIETAEISVYPVTSPYIQTCEDDFSRIGACALAGSPYNKLYAGMAELVDAVDLKSIACKGVRVRVPLSAPSLL